MAEVKATIQGKDLRIMFNFKVKCYGFMIVFEKIFKEY
jgi:hypothetical protein